MEKNDLLPDGFTVGKRLGGTKLGDDQYEMKSVGFFREINNYEMWGRSDITVEICKDGVSAVISIYNDYEFDRNVSCLSLDDVKTLNPLECGQVIYHYDELSDDQDHVVLNDVQIMYYDSPVNQPELSHIQPVYQFTGKIVDKSGNSTDYCWTIPAIKR